MILVKEKDELIYDLIFSENWNYSIDISDYIKNIYEYESFVDEIKEILKKSKVKIMKSALVVDSKTAIWELKVKK